MWGGGGFAFRAGESVQVRPPGGERPAWLSVCSTPRQLREDGTLDLLVRRSGHPAVEWLLDAEPGAAGAELRPGGGLHATDPQARRPMLLVAGGVGVAPLYSIARDSAEGWLERLGRKPLGATPLEATASGQGEAPASALPRAALPPGAGFRAIVLYSAEEPREHALLGGLRELEVATGGRVGVRRHVTGATWEGREAEWGGEWGFVGKAHLERALGELQSAGEPTTAFVCGPPAMADSIAEKLESLSLPPEAIRLERWW